LQLEGEDENDGWGLKGKSRWILLFYFQLVFRYTSREKGEPLFGSTSDV